MIRYYYKTLRTKKVDELHAYKPGCWVYVEAPTTEEIESLVKVFKLDAGHIEDALDPDEMPRLEKEGDLNYIFIRYAFTNEKGELDTAPLLFVAGPDLLITIAPGELPRLQSFVTGKLGFATTQRTRLVLLILDQIADQYETFINKLGRQINAIRTRLKGHEISNQDFIDFVTIEDELNEFLAAMEPTTVILRRLLGGRHIPLFEEDQDLVEDLLLNNEQSIESCRAHVKSITSIREAYSTIASNNLNHTMKLLTGVTVLITLPNVIFGMYGMNIGLPFQHEPWAYLFVFGSSIFICFIVYIVARRNRIF
ncbi:MAG TPA: magnesium transporter CorA family protein [Candidatus Saccharimonadales bacterium]|nr:magnesium transporter CorA family protein [Candidatus Saccharimonadales bacterium]